MATAPEKIVILGGGVAALTTAFQLTDQQDWQKKYDITVYQMGWRLGGKGASGRDQSGRIIEHGLHLWFGFYENAFSIMKRCLAEYQQRNLYPDSPLRTIDQAFSPQAYYEYDEFVDNAWNPWRMSFKVTPNVYPGDGKTLISLAGAIQAVVEKMYTAVNEALNPKPKKRTVKSQRAAKTSAAPTHLSGWMKIMV
jgi:uncharacterized protein with NAD-binding domain and iron-sulfur cluster